MTDENEGARSFTVHSADGVMWVTLSNPPVNLFDASMLRDLRVLLDDLSSDASVRVVVFRSAIEGFFIAHFDVASILSIDPARWPTDRLNPVQALCERLRTLDKITIAEIDGRVGGGGSELAMSLDMRFASARSVFNQPEVALGIIPGGSGTVRLPRLIGRSRALEVILGCDDVDADTAERYGWINRSMPAEVLHAWVGRLAMRIATFPPDAVRLAKQAVLAHEGDLTPHLVAENAKYGSSLGAASTAAMRRFLELGGQTRDGEARLGGLLRDLDPAG